MNPDRMAYSGQLVFAERILIDGHFWHQMYTSYLEFDSVAFYPAVNNRWQDHYLGERDGVFTVMFLDDASPSNFKKVLR